MIHLIFRITDKFLYKRQYAVKQKKKIAHTHLFYNEKSYCFYYH